MPYMVASVVFWTFSSIAGPHYQHTSMDGELLDSTTLNTLKEERQRLRHFISMKRTAAQVIPNSVNFEDFKAKFNRLQEIEERILGHMLAENTDVEAALASHQKYADMAE